GKAMAKLCGEVKIIEKPVGGGMHHTTTEYQYSDGSTETKQNWYKSRMFFPTIQIGTGPALNKVLVANDQLGHDIADNVRPGDNVCMFTYGHLLRKQCIIGVKSDKGTFAMPGRGFASGLFWYAVFSPIVVGIPAAIIGMIVGMLGGQQGTAMGLMFGVLYAIGISWYSAYRFYTAYKEMQASI